MSLEFALSQDQRKQVARFRKEHPNVNAIEGVIRLGVTIDEVSNILRTYEWSQSYIAALEIDPNDHIHFCIFNNKKKIPISGVRDHFKKCIELIGKAPIKYHNGMLNIDRIEDSFAMVAYILKEQNRAEAVDMQIYGPLEKDDEPPKPFIENEHWIAHGLYIEDVKLAMKVSYKKISNFAKKIRELYLAVSHGQMTAGKALAEFRMMKKNALSPETNVMKIAKAFLEISKSREVIETESNDLINYLLEQDSKFT